MSKLNLALYEKLYLIRRAEKTIQANYFDDEMKTPMHMSMGAEAIAAGICQALSLEDQVFGSYRSHAIYLSKTGNTDDFFAEMYGKGTSLLKGKGGSMHMCAPDYGFMGTSAIVASSIPVAVGAAFANKQLGNGKVSVVFFGDGAIDEGSFWESLNLACLMKLPVLFVCEDNGFAVHTPAHARHGYKSITDIVSRFDCKVFKEESTDAEVIYKLARRAIRTVRTGLPGFMHLKYYRYLEHVGVSEDYEAGYRPEEEYREWQARDPIDLQRAKLLRAGTAANLITDLESRIDRQVEKSLALAKAAPFSDVSDMYAGVWAE